MLEQAPPWAWINLGDCNLGVDSLTISRPVTIRGNNSRIIIKEYILIDLGRFDPVTPSHKETQLFVTRDSAECGQGRFFSPDGSSKCTSQHHNPQSRPRQRTTSVAPLSPGALHWLDTYRQYADIGISDPCPLPTVTIDGLDIDIHASPSIPAYPLLQQETSPIDALFSISKNSILSLESVSITCTDPTRSLLHSTSDTKEKGQGQSLSSVYLQSVMLKGFKSLSRDLKLAELSISDSVLENFAGSLLLTQSHSLLRVKSTVFRDCEGPVLVQGLAVGSSPVRVEISDSNFIGMKKDCIVLGNKLSSGRAVSVSMQGCVFSKLHAEALSCTGYLGNLTVQDCTFESIQETVISLNQVMGDSLSVEGCNFIKCSSTLIYCNHTTAKFGKNNMTGGKIGIHVEEILDDSNSPYSVAAESLYTFTHHQMDTSHLSTEQNGGSFKVPSGKPRVNIMRNQIAEFSTAGIFLSTSKHSSVEVRENNLSKNIIGLLISNYQQEETGPNKILTSQNMPTPAHQSPTLQKRSQIPSRSKLRGSAFAFNDAANDGTADGCTDRLSTIQNREIRTSFQHRPDILLVDNDIRNNTKIGVKIDAYSTVIALREGTIRDNAVFSLVYNKAMIGWLHIADLGTNKIKFDASPQIVANYEQDGQKLKSNRRNSSENCLLI